MNNLSVTIITKDEEKNIIEEAEIVAKKNDYKIYYLKTRKDNTYNLILLSSEFFNRTIFSRCV